MADRILPYIPGTDVLTICQTQFRSGQNSTVMVESPETESRVSRVTGVSARMAESTVDAPHGVPAGIVPALESSLVPMAQAATTVALTEKLDVLVAAAARTTMGAWRKLPVSKTHAAMTVNVRRIETGTQSSAHARFLDITAFHSFAKEKPFWQGRYMVAPTDDRGNFYNLSSNSKHVKLFSNATKDEL